MFVKDKDTALEETNMNCLYFVIIGVVMAISTFTQIYTYGVAGEKLTMRIRSMSFSAMIKQEIAWFDLKSNSVGALCARLSGDASSIQGVSLRKNIACQALLVVFVKLSRRKGLRGQGTWPYACSVLPKQKIYW